MAGPSSPNTEGPSKVPPQLPSGWIAQWDSSTRKYYFVQLSTGVSQWETPTTAAPVGEESTSRARRGLRRVAAGEDNGGVALDGRAGRRGVESDESEDGSESDDDDGPRDRGVQGWNVERTEKKKTRERTRDSVEVITHPDGSQTLKHADGSLEPVLPPEEKRAVEGKVKTTNRGLGSLLGSALNAAVSHHSSSTTNAGGSSSHGGKSPLVNFAGQVVTNLAHAHSSSGSHGQGNSGHASSHGSSSGLPGKLVGELAANFFSGGGHKPSQQQHQSGAPPTASGGLSGVLHDFMGGGKAHGSQASNSYGYSDSGQPIGTYSGQAPPPPYQAQTSSTVHQQPSYHAPPHSSGHNPSQPAHSSSTAPSYHPPPPPSSTYTHSSPSQPAASSYQSPPLSATGHHQHPHHQTYHSPHMAHAPHQSSFPTPPIQRPHQQHQQSTSPYTHSHHPSASGPGQTYPYSETTDHYGVSASDPSSHHHRPHPYPQPHQQHASYVPTAPPSHMPLASSPSFSPYQQAYVDQQRPSHSYGQPGGGYAAPAYGHGHGHGHG